MQPTEGMSWEDYCAAENRWWHNYYDAHVSRGFAPPSECSPTLRPADSQDSQEDDEPPADSLPDSRVPSPFQLPPPALMPEGTSYDEYCAGLSSALWREEDGIFTEIVPPPSGYDEVDVVDVVVDAED
jgi:hypothetical protein